MSIINERFQQKVIKLNRNQYKPNNLLKLHDSNRSFWSWVKIFSSNVLPKLLMAPVRTLILRISVQVTHTNLISQIGKFMGPTLGPPGSCRPQMGPMLAPWTLLLGMFQMGIAIIISPVPDCRLGTTLQSIGPIACLVMSWLLASPGHQQACQW